MYKFDVAPLYYANYNSKAQIVINQGGTDCFQGSQLVVTSKGSKPISLLKEGDLVLSKDFVNDVDVFKPVLDVFKFKNNKKTVKINLKNGKTIVCTEDHQFFFNGKWVSVGKMLSLLDGTMGKDTEL